MLRPRCTDVVKRDHGATCRSSWRLIVMIHVVLQRLPPVQISCRVNERHELFVHVVLTIGAWRTWIERQTVRVGMPIRRRRRMLRRGPAA